MDYQIGIATDLRFDMMATSLEAPVSGVIRRVYEVRNECVRSVQKNRSILRYLLQAKMDKNIHERMRQN